MARIQDEQIEAARNVSIADVWLHLGLPQVRAGTAFHSPFREDRNPSCQLGGEKNIFFDHATGESMDTIALTRKVRGCDFVEAVAFVLGRTPEDLAGKNGSRDPSRSRTGPSASPAPDAIEELARVRRSEERRVGKECRSRWSPYH